MAVGYITNGMRGARYAMRGARLLGKRKRGNRQTSYAGNKRRLVSRSRFVGRKTYRKKAIRTSRAFSKQVSTIAKRVINKDTPTGRYYRVWGGKNSQINPTANVQRFSKNVDGNSNYTSGVLLNHLSFFTVRTLVDVVSTLFNNKLATLTQTSSLVDFQDINLKFVIQYAQATVSFKNGANIAMDVEVFDCSHKFGTNDSVVTMFNDALNSQNLIQVGGPAQSHFNLAVKPFSLPLMNKSYKHKVVKRTLQPGETMYCNVTLPLNFMFDKSKYGEGSVNYEYQPFSHELMYNLTPTPMWGVKGATGEGRTGRYWQGNTSSTAQNCGLIIEVKETYVVDCPKDTDHAFKNDNYCFFNGYPTSTDFSPDHVTNVAKRDHLVTTDTGFE